MRVPRRLRPTLTAAATASVALALFALLLCFLTPGCDEAAPPPPPPAADDPALTIDGEVITRGAIDDYLAYVRKLDPTMGENSAIRVILDQHLIPLAFARRQLAAERAVQEERAGGLARVFAQGGYDDFAARTQQQPGREPYEDTLRQALPLAEQRWLFDDLNIGRVSPVIETPQGFSLVAAADKRHGTTAAFDRVDALAVRFYTHKAKEFGEWQQRLKQRLAGLAKDRVVVHPDYRDAMPAWLPAH